MCETSRRPMPDAAAAEGHEHHREPGDEEADAAQHRAHGLRGGRSGGGGGSGGGRGGGGGAVEAGAMAVATDPPGVPGPEKVTGDPTAPGATGADVAPPEGISALVGAVVAVVALDAGELGGREARDHRDVAGDERQHARGEEGEDPGAEGDQDAKGVRCDRGGQRQGVHEPRLADGATDQVHVRVDHHGHEAGEVDLALPAQHRVRPLPGRRPEGRPRRDGGTSRRSPRAAPSRGRPPRRPARQSSRTEWVSPGRDDVVIGRCPAAASATWRGRSRRRSPSRAGRRGCRGTACRPGRGRCAPRRW